MINITFERSYPTALATSPLLPMLLLSLATQRNNPKQATQFKEEYDYIIVGGGSAGSVVASRLSEMPCVSVLLLEAGDIVPPLLNDVPALARQFWFTNLDWQFKTVPQKHTGLGLVNRQVIWPSGKGLGGSGLLNAMFNVRGNRKNYDDWAAQGATGWSFKDVFPYFVKLEDNRNSEYVANGYHGVGGPITVEKPLYNSEIKNPLFEAAQKFGIRIGDSNGPIQTGFYDFQCFIRNGQRCSSAKAYLVPVENRTNLDIVGGAHVRRVLLNGTQVVGVEFDYKNSTYQVKAKREVIMSAGTTNTAQLLMLSGIGPKKHLQKFKIPVVADLPVGNNFQDHCGVIVPFQLDPKTLTVNQKLTNFQNIRDYIDSRTGPLNSAEFISNIAFLNATPQAFNVDFPDYQLYFVETPKELVRDQIGIIPLIYKTVFGPYEDKPMALCLSQILHPKSIGTVRLKSTNPYDMPLIDPNYFADKSDLRDMVEGLKMCQKIMTSEPLKKAGVKPFETMVPICSIFKADPDKFFTCFAKSFVATLSHQVGTAKMGDPKDPTTVVDPQLRVKGIQGLRVVDASIMPIVPSGNTNIPTIMVAEKASDIIKETINCPSEAQPASDYDTEYAYDYYYDYYVYA